MRGQLPNPSEGLTTSHTLTPKFHCASHNPVRVATSGWSRVIEMPPARTNSVWWHFLKPGCPDVKKSRR